ncbi:hypothetical protein [uncultured Sphingomonas sp.]|uniref:hypothetical protein n=1 Tax=uncultured Sphingomonas sp. TaxID=158754 RepID=UPI0025F00DA6|nr:hypothetical protein [uncultured Sphingomonas sp.]
MSEDIDPQGLGPDLDGDGARFWRGLAFGLPLSLLLWGLIIGICHLLFSVPA